MSKFAKISFEAIEQIKDRTLFRVYAALCRYRNFRSGQTFVSDKTAASLAGMSVRHFIRQRSKLRELGWISWEYRHGTTNLYTINDVPGMSQGTDIAVSQGSDIAVADKVEILKRDTKERDSQTSISSDDALAKKVYDAWARKVKELYSIEPPYDARKIGFMVGDFERNIITYFRSHPTVKTAFQTYEPKLETRLVMYLRWWLNKNNLLARQNRWAFTTFKETHCLEQYLRREPRIVTMAEQERSEQAFIARAGIEAR
jgi:hypothetical protein